MKVLLLIVAMACLVMGDPIAKVDVLNDQCATCNPCGSTQWFQVCLDCCRQYDMGVGRFGDKVVQVK
ncbi:hypothetical protein L596_006238 [Steinernema carpocapsae]|uniref:Uncharacterized protein n=1 Tax=Steinernema carpocapsae TaxID=34508 RepID=A0A4U8V7F7_STECR|nr:hypothetical protein L596_006238 [Steinernema carpocapsae]